MENEIKEKKYIGKYIRNKYGIAKIVDVLKENDIIFLKLDNNIVFDVNRETGEVSDKYLRNIYPITEHTDLKGRIKDLIDLIQCGDYVNGLIIDEVENDRNPKLIWHLSAWGDEDVPYKNEDIKEVVTKEQFESISYKVTKM